MEQNELERIRCRYERRDSANGQTRFWTLQNPVVVHMAQERERLMLALLGKKRIELDRRTILDVGCGMGGEFVNYLRWGAYKSNIVGIDLMFERLVNARKQLEANVIHGSGHALPFADETFDIIFQNVVFTSIIDRALKAKIADEMTRVLKRDGYIIWYDAVRSRSKDPHYCPIPKSEIRELFPKFNMEFHSLTTDLGALKLAYKTLGRFGLGMIELIPVFKTHTIAIGCKAVGSPSVNTTGA